MAGSGLGAGLKRSSYLKGFTSRRTRRGIILSLGVKKSYSQSKSERSNAGRIGQDHWFAQLEGMWVTFRRWGHHRWVAAGGHSQKASLRRNSSPRQENPKLTNAEGIRVRKIMVITVSGKKHQWMLKPVGENIRRNQIFSLKASPYKILIITKGQRVALQWRSLADTTTLIKWSKDIASEGQIDITCHLVWCTEKDTASLFCCFCQEC